MTGRTGRTHGARIVRTPAMNERSARVTIEKNMKDRDYTKVYMGILTIDEENAKRKKYG